MAGLLENWSSHGNCTRGGTDPDAMFVTGAEQQIAKRLCNGCPVTMECLADALDNRIEFGVWGGKTERERRAMIRRYPRVESWRRLFETAMQQHAASQGTAETSLDQQTNVAPALGDRAMDTIPPPIPRRDTDQIT